MQYQSIVDSSFEAVDQEVTNKVVPFLEQVFSPESQLVFTLDFAIRELLNNAVEHGNAFSRDKQVRLSIRSFTDEVRVEVADEGLGFDVQQAVAIASSGQMLRERQRGLATLVGLGFCLQSQPGYVNATLKLNKLGVRERAVEQMLVQLEEGALVCVLKANLVASNAKDTVDKLKTEFKKHQFQRVELDLSEVNSINSMGITVLVGAYKTLAAEGKTLRLVGVSPRAMQLLKIMKLDDIFDIESG